MAVENGRPATFLSKKMEADENWAVGFQSNRLTPFYGNGATAKIDIFGIPMVSEIVFFAHCVGRHHGHRRTLRRYSFKHVPRWSLTG